MNYRILLLFSLTILGAFRGSSYVASASDHISGPARNSSVTNIVHINWNQVVIVSKTTATLQLVVNPMIRRGSPIHKGTFEALSSLNTSLIRFVPWAPYPRLVVAELFAPTKQPQCWIIPEGTGVYISCPPGQNFESVEYASFGAAPSGSCGEWVPSPSCSIDASEEIANLCLPNYGCFINTSSTFWNVTCPKGANTMLSVQLKCSPASEQTSWNFGLIDPMMEDFFAATKGRSTIINFSTIPEWMWNANDEVYIPDDPNQVYWVYELGASLRDPSLKELGDYYERLVSYLVKGQFTDEYGVVHKSKNKYSIPYWEILNEPSLEHGMSVEYYTQVYDAMTAAIRRAAPDMKFVALAMSDRNPTWISYFLDDNNHAPGYVVPEYISYHFYAGANRLNATEFEGFFDQADDFFKQVADIEIIRKRLKPSMKTTMDEVGVILNGDPNGGPINQEFWAAASGLYAYILSQMTLAGIDAVGESQLVGYPSQFPSVSMMDWTNGKPNARFWVLKLFVDEFSVGDKLVSTSITPSDSVYAQARLCVDGNKKVLLINKTVNLVTVHVPNAQGAVIKIVDTKSGDNPATVMKLTSSTFTLTPFATVVVILAPQ